MNIKSLSITITYLLIVTISGQTTEPTDATYTSTTTPPTDAITPTQYTHRAQWIYYNITIDFAMYDVDSRYAYLMKQATIVYFSNKLNIPENKCEF